MKYHVDPDKSSLVDANKVIHNQDEFGYFDIGGDEFTPDAIEALLNEVMPLAEISQGMSLSYNSLAKAAREGRLQARQSRKTWLATIAAVKQALESGKLQPHIGQAGLGEHNSPA